MSQIISITTIIALAMISIINSDPTAKNENVYFKVFGFFNIERHHSIKLCGPALEKAISELCRGKGYNKRFGFDSYSKVNLTQNYLPIAPSNGLISLTQSLLENMMNKNSQRFNRKLRGVNDECCINSCTLETLVTYCKPATTAKPMVTMDFTSE